MFQQIKLPYGFADLEPVIDALTVETHYTKHHATYTKNFNDLVAKAPALAGKSAWEILSELDALPQELRQGIRNNGGGFYNHNLYFEALCPRGGQEPTSGPLFDAVQRDLGGFAPLKEKLAAASAGQFGSGYGWLCADRAGKLSITATANQDCPVSLGLCPLLTIDVWEHAYYLKYRNLRADYIGAIFNIVDWRVVQQRYEKRGN